MSSRVARSALAMSLVVSAGSLIISVPGFAAQPTAPAAASQAGEQVGLTPLDYSRLKTWTESSPAYGESMSDSSPEQLNAASFIQDTSTNARWVFPADNGAFVAMLGKLNGAGSGNLAQLAYVGLTIGNVVAHGAWIAPLTSGKTPSAVPADLDLAGARSFDAAALSVKWSDAAHAYVLTDGNGRIADAQSQAPLTALQSMIQSYGLNTVWEVPSENAWPTTPVGSEGPTEVFFKLAPGASTGMASCSRLAWLQPKCWSGKI